MGLNNRVVVTGMGAVSPYGVGAGQLIEGAWSGTSCIRVMEEWRSIKGLASFIAAPVPSIDFKKHLPRSARRTMGDMAAYATLASREAVADAGLPEETLRSGEVGVVIGSTTGSPAVYQSLYEEFLWERSIESFTSGLFFKIMGHSCSANVMQTLGINGEQWAPTSACTSSAQAIGLGYLLVQSGRQQAVLCGGADEVHHSVTMFFDILRAASHRNDDPAGTPRPFELERDGVVCGGGCGILILENLDSARKRGARIYGEITGFGNVSDPSHIANPHADAMSRAIRKALDEAGVTGSDVDYVNAHATGTVQGDQAEIDAIYGAIGSQVPVSSLKGHIGHTLAAAGSLETLLVLAMIERQEILPTLHLHQIDPACAKGNLVRTTTPVGLKTVVKNSFALGGVNVALVLKKYNH